MENKVYYQPIVTLEYNFNGDLSDITSTIIFEDLEEANKYAQDQVEEFKSNSFYKKYKVTYCIQNVYLHAHSKH